jgi:hypothetical protein
LTSHLKEFSIRIENSFRWLVKNLDLIEKTLIFKIFKYDQNKKFLILIVNKKSGKQTLFIQESYKPL